MTTATVMLVGLIAALTPSCESTHQELNSIDDLKMVDFGQSVPNHSLILLFWFANEINIDQRNTITMAFDPQVDFGSHHYGNYEGLLELPRGHRYFTVGNLNSDQLPGYVRSPPDFEYEGGNTDRIVFSAERQHSGAYRIHRVYLTQHDGRQTTYNPAHTYQISINLLRQIRRFSNGNRAALERLRDQFDANIRDSELSALRGTWGDALAGLGLLLFVLQSRSFTYIQQSKTRPSTAHNKETDGICFCICAVLILIMFVSFIILASRI